MKHYEAVLRKCRQYVARGPILAGIALALGLASVSASEARASTYRVYTASAASSMVLNPSDGFCSLAEAVQHARGNAIYNCTDFAPGSSGQRIELLESANRPYSTNHFTISGNNASDALTLSRQGVPIRIVGSGSGAFIDSTMRYSAFVIPFKSIGYFERVTLTNTAGSAGGRLIENFGELGLNFVTITKGNVTGAHHLTGRGGGIFNGNTPGISYPAFISYAQNSVITGNFARKGGGIYNDSGVINELSVTISNNTATDGGGIYNISTSPPGGTVTNGLILSIATKVQGNKARAGAGIFNRGLIELRVGSAITGNSTTATGTSEESCIGSASCDGLGGGVLSAHVAGGSETRFLLASSVISNNSASARGGAIYSVGVLELHGTTINTNTAADGGALYVVAPPAGVLQYCKVYADGGSGNATINGNTASAGYSIVSGGANGETDFRKCNFYGMRYPGEPTYLTASGNSGPNFCRSAALDSSSSPCPEPCGGLNQTCCSATSTGCNAGLTCRAPVPAGGSASCQP